MSARDGSGSDDKPYANDPLYRHLSRVRARASEEARKEVRNARRCRRRASDPDCRDKERARRYGLKLEDYRAILARQGNACAICGQDGKPLCIDHCHASGKVRGLLCSKCNTGLGCYDDDPAKTDAATAYLKAARADG